MFFLKQNIFPIILMHQKKSFGYELYFNKIMFSVILKYIYIYIYVQ
jgi:hypothetical protein